MLSARPRLLPPARSRSRVTRAGAVVASVALHAALLALLLPRHGRALPPPPQQPVEIELVQQAAETRGAPPPAPPVPAAKPAPATPAAPAAAASPPLSAPPNGTDVAPPSTPAAASAAAAESPPPQREVPEVNLGNGLRDVDPLTVTGTNVVPPKPDARYHNQPPHYPAAAARIGAQGTAQVVAHIAPNGQAVSVDIVESSGNVDLDDEARRAVLRWHFQPARVDGRAVPFDYVVNIHFALGDR